MTTAPLEAARALEARLPASLPLQPAHRQPVLAAFRGFRSMLEPGAEEGLARVIAEHCGDGEPGCFERDAARAIQAHFATLAMGGGDNG